MEEKQQKEKLSSLPRFSMPVKTIFLICLILLGVLVFTLTDRFTQTASEIPIELLAVIKQTPRQLNDFILIDQNNNPFTLEQLKNRNTLLFFGYTSCPDICPTTLTTLNDIYKKLVAAKNKLKLNYIFVSVDPERDTIDRLSSYMDYFNPEFLAVTGSKSQIDAFIRQFGASYIINEKESDGNYLVSHTSSIFLIDSRQNIIASFSPPHKADTLLVQLDKMEDYLTKP